MAPQTPRSLKHKVDGRQVGCDQIEVQIKALLRHLGGNQNLSAVPIAALAKGFQNMVFAHLPLFSWKAGMEEKHFRPVGQALANTQAFAFKKFTFRKKRR